MEETATLKDFRTVDRSTKDTLAAGGRDWLTRLTMFGRLNFRDHFQLQFVTAEYVCEQPRAYYVFLLRTDQS
jgi:hypothetical protein